MDLVAPIIRTPVEELITVLKPHPENYVNHPADQIEEIKASIKDHGLYRNIVISKDYFILAGHGVIEACKQLGIEKVPVVVMPFPHDHIGAKKLMVADNETSHLREIDDRKLSEILKLVQEEDQLEGTGYTKQMLANLCFITRPKSEINSMNEAAAWAGMPDYDESEAPFRVIVAMETEADREAFMNLIGSQLVNKKQGKTWSIWYPERERDDSKSIRFETKE